MLPIAAIAAHVPSALLTASTAHLLGAQSASSPTPSTEVAAQPASMATTTQPQAPVYCAARSAILAQVQAPTA